MKSLLQKVLMLSVFIAGFIFLASASATTVHAATPPHKIKADNTKLYDSVTGKIFNPRGANYVRLAQTATGATYHSAFEPGRYNVAAARAFLDQMARYKYNTVRVFIDPGNTDANNAHGIGRGMGTHDTVYGPYMDNFASFVNEAAVRGIYVLPSMDVFPQNTYYWTQVAGANADGFSNTNIASRNSQYMSRTHIAAKAEYMKQFAQALINRVGANESAILAYQSDNELFYEANKPPFDKLSGTAKPANGVVYDMSKPYDRQQAADASMVYYANLIKSELLTVNPNALMTIGFFTNRAVKKTSYDGFMTAYCSTNCKAGVDYRVPGRPLALSMWSTVDFLDIHLYPPANPHVLSTDLSSIEEAGFKKAYILGEFGALKSVYGNNINTAATAMQNLRVSTCQEGAQGWLFWTWDTYENLASQSLFYKLNESGGAINNKMAPSVQPNPCSTRNVVKVEANITMPAISKSPAR